MEVQQGLTSSGISAVVNGHQPFGDGPLVISHDKVRVVTFDTSYSNDTLWEDSELEENVSASLEDGNGTRGKAVGEIIFIQTVSNSSESRSDVNIHGKLSNREEYDYMLTCPLTQSTPTVSSQMYDKDKDGVRVVDMNNVIGYEIDGWWTRALLCNNRILLCKGHGYQVSNKVCSMDYVLAKMEASRK